MPIGKHRDGFFYSILTFMMDSYHNELAGIQHASYHRTTDIVRGINILARHDDTSSRSLAFRPLLYR